MPPDTASVAQGKQHVNVCTQTTGPKRSCAIRSNTFEADENGQPQIVLENKRMQERRAQTREVLASTFEQLANLHCVKDANTDFKLWSAALAFADALEPLRGAKPVLPSDILTHLVPASVAKRLETVAAKQLKLLVNDPHRVREAREAQSLPFNASHAFAKEWLKVVQEEYATNLVPCNDRQLEAAKEVDDIMEAIVPIAVNFHEVGWNLCFFGAIPLIVL